jgi:protein SCO1/2
MTGDRTGRRYRGLRLLAFSFLAAGLALLAWVGVALYQGTSPLGSSDAPSALVGGDFTATDHTGRRVTQADFRGRYMLVYFGFTFCPDICPGELQIIGATMDLLGPAAAKVTPVFVTVDPERDTPEVLADYVPHFHDRMVGLTGSVDEVGALARAWRVYYRKVEDENMPGGYTMDHSSIIYLMDPDGRFVRHFNHGTPPEDIAAALKEILS